MRFLRTRAVCLGLLLGACGSPPPSESPRASAPPPVVAEVEEPVALQPVAAPKELVLLGRLSDPQGLFAKGASWANLPFALAPLVGREWPELSGQLRLDAPIELAAAFDPESPASAEPLFAVSLPLVDYGATLERLRAKGKKLERVSPNQQFVTFGANQRCLVARALGSASARLICSDRRQSLDLLGPYLATGLPNQPIGTRVRSLGRLAIELRAEPIRARFGQQARWLKVAVPVLLREVSLGDARFDGALSDAAHAVADELLALIEDVDRLALETELSDADTLEVDFGLVMRGQRSFVARAIQGRSGEATPAPEMFWRLPADASHAQYHTGTRDPKLYAPLIHSVTELMAGAAEHFEISSKALDAWLEQTKAVSGLAEVNSVLAEGPNSVATSGPADPEATFAALMGWQLYGVSGDRGTVVAWLDQAVRVFNEPAWRKELSRRMTVPELADLPKVRTHKARAGQPKGSVWYELTLPPDLFDAAASEPSKPKASKAKPSLTVWAATLIDGERSWIVVGPEPALLADKLSSVVAAPPERTLSSRQGLQAMRATPALAGGYVSASGIFERLEPFAKFAGAGGTSIAQLIPHQGKTPILYRYATEAEGPAVWLECSVPRAAVEELVAGAVGLAAAAEAD